LQAVFGNLLVPRDCILHFRVLRLARKERLICSADF
jgi:hypothetical protein